MKIKISNLPQVARKWRQCKWRQWGHVQTILRQNKGLQESLSWAQFWSYNRFLCIKWRRIDSRTELLSQIFKIWKKKETVCQIFVFLICFVVKTRIYVIELIKVNQFWKFQLDMSKNGWHIYDISFFCIRDMAINVHHSNANLDMFRTSHNKIKGTIGILN